MCNKVLNESGTCTTKTYQYSIGRAANVPLCKFHGVDHIKPQVLCERHSTVQRAIVGAGSKREATSGRRIAPAIQQTTAAISVQLVVSNVLLILEGAMPRSAANLWSHPVFATHMYENIGVYTCKIRLVSTAM